MLKKIISPQTWRKKNPIEPVVYSVLCKKCGYTEDFELNTSNSDVATHEGHESPFPKIVEKIPTNCPICQAKLKQRKVPIKICY